MKPFKPKPCPDCGRRPKLWEVTFFGYALPKFKVECPNCKKKTAYYMKSQSAASAWDNGNYAPERPDRERWDNEGLMDLMGRVMDEINSDYQRIASRETLTGWEISHIQEMEDFVMENPYMLPYDREYVVQEMRRLAEASRNKKPRKKQVS